MSQTVFCKKFQKDLPAMTIPPMPGPKGKELMETVSQEAWESWKSHQTTLINEKHLDLSQADARSWLLEQMEKFFNNEEVEQASGFKALD
ncbi:oxidative damage protection protein [Gammaproteobacteria bacterium]|jgi:Fe-S cluster biosynthesis and repair protein YggX|nr:oxidative damage protection protein [Gammaproteobacteria bacterium]MDA9965012.1 oxidative damage protection protein [Gammaproteobacteria bacterium]MDB0010573.1 oxidative damage protection protein [Gammaproteobacteria bacterium]MDC0905803.1 oxidative damage protection protein [Gammaproteobacteria bacterium]MDC1042789.1 oxidative damage protection protein [Gammaproteobacteria bacterium]